jgi:phosphoribosylcarboxyaminoimidazole (NCAIR) mutase
LATNDDALALKLHEFKSKMREEVISKDKKLNN